MLVCKIIQPLLKSLNLGRTLKDGWVRKYEVEIGEKLAKWGIYFVPIHPSIHWPFLQCQSTCKMNHELIQGNMKIKMEKEWKARKCKGRR